MADVVQNMRAGLSRLTPRQRTHIAVALVAIVGIVWGLSLWATRVRYGVLFTNLRGEDAAPVLSALKEKRIPYRLSAGGSVVEVPMERVDELRLELAGEGLPRAGGVGFEIFDKPSFGLSDFVQNVNYRRALERELARTIQTLDSVESARVHLALPPPSVFADEQKSPSASVVVRLRSSRSLSSNQVRAIEHLVASGVDGLDPARVSVIDGHGRMLSGGEARDGGDALSASQLDAKRSIESGLETTLVSILEPVVGAGRVRARATVEMNLARVQKVEETWSPDGAVVRSEQKSRTRRSATGSGGVPGTASNLPGGAPSAAATSGGSEEQQATTTNFEISKTVATIQEPSGTLARQSVAVVVDNTVTEAAGPDGKAERKSTPRSDDEMKKITEIVRAAVGIDENRGDVLIVQNIPFDSSASAAEKEVNPGDRWRFWLTIARYASLPLAVLLVLLFLVRPGLAAVRSLRTSPGGSGGPPTIAELQASLAAGELPAGGSTLRRKLIEAAGADPEAAALVVRGWLGAKKGD